MSGGPLPIEPLTKTAFAPFGDVIETDGCETRVINQGFALRRHDLARVEIGDGGRTCVSIFEARRRPRPLAIDMLEKHPLASQAFYPLSREAWLVVVAEGGEEPDLSTLRCFRARGDQGVNYAAGVWHFPVLTIAERQGFFIVDREGDAPNLVERFFAPDEVRFVEES
ncbi:ureidoglycolate lyase [Chelatococcus sambhunathii]|uniref:Ureidoglycolate lyase n=1 Tax=Chelatococcus sambhunathii TaxID=363953 RepID=A0ABU1DAR3_9HYPH|nr:ureidoglycolate lyase [Chelatococcus sambhunathii]MDR4305199.1 ureidoglycolate lyase [Chelatococcus sambhunathii]